MMIRNLIVISILAALLYPAASFADPSDLEGTSGDVSGGSKPGVNQEITVSKANITSVLHLTPLSKPPANPSPGDIYFTTTDELLIYANGKWTLIVSASAIHGTMHITSGSGTWTVPAGTHSLTVTLVGGGGGGGGGNYYRQPGEDKGRCLSGGSGGSGGVQLKVFKDVAPGQQVAYSVGSGGSAGRTSCDFILGPTCSSINSSSGGTTVFGDLSASGGQGGSPKESGSNGSPAGTYPHGLYGQGGAGSATASCRGVYAGAVGAEGASGAIYIQY